MFHSRGILKVMVLGCFRWNGFRWNKSFNMFFSGGWGSFSWIPFERRQFDDYKHLHFGFVQGTRVENCPQARLSDGVAWLSKSTCLVWFSTNDANLAPYIEIEYTGVRCRKLHCQEKTLPLYDFGRCKKLVWLVASWFLHFWDWGSSRACKRRRLPAPLLMVLP